MRLERRRSTLERLAGALVRLRPDLTARRAAALGTLADRFAMVAQRSIERRRMRLRDVDGKLGGNDPATILQRGYAIVRVGERFLRDPADAPPGTRVSAELARGTLYARVERETADGGKQIGLF